MIYTVGGIKGGVGKTTVAVNLVVWLTQQGHEVLLVDTDFQQSSTHFTNWREQALGETGYTNIVLQGESVRREVLSFKKKYKQIVIDAGGNNTNSQRAAVTVSDVYLLPFQPTSIDVATGSLIEEIVAAANASTNRKIRAYAFLSRAFSTGRDNAEAGEILSELQGIKFLPEVLIKNRKIYSNAVTGGKSVFEMGEGPQALKARQEMETLFSIVTKK